MSHVTVRPAAYGAGVTFIRADLPGRPRLPAAWDAVGSLRLCTTLQRGGADVSTVEHLLAALGGMGVDDAVVEVNGREVPILDGSAAPFVRMIQEAGVVQGTMPLRWIRVTRTIEVGDPARGARIEPAEGFSVDCGIDFGDQVVGRSTCRWSPAREPFSQVAAARTFAFESDVAMLRAAGLARGGSLDNALVVGEHGVLNPGGTRFKDEFARHKLLDVVGDLALAGAPIRGRVVTWCAGHEVNNMLLRRLFGSRDCWTWCVAGREDPSSLVA